MNTSKRIEESEPLEVTILFSDLLHDARLHDLLKEGSVLANQLMENVGYLCRMAFSEGSPTAKRQLHKILNEVYNSLLRLPLNYVVLKNIDHHVISKVIRKIEEEWEKYEESRAIINIDTISIQTDLKSTIHSLVTGHRASKHPLFDCLEAEADRSQFLKFFAFDYSLNMLFFDLLALALPGLEGNAKQEVMQNLWDESGRGNSLKSHTSMYELITSRLLPDFDSKAIISQSDFQLFAGSNLFAFFGLRRANLYKYMGCMAATEILDPPQYNKLLAGANRIGLDKDVDLAYYSEHSTIDIVHAAGWLDNVMVPLAEGSKEIERDMLLGVLMRLNTCSDYYDMLVNKLDL